MSLISGKPYLIRNKANGAYVQRALTEDKSLLPKRVISVPQEVRPEPVSLQSPAFLCSNRSLSTVVVHWKRRSILCPQGKGSPCVHHSWPRFCFTNRRTWYWCEVENHCCSTSRTSCFPVRVLRLSIQGHFILFSQHWVPDQVWRLGFTRKRTRNPGERLQPFFHTSSTLRQCIKKK